MLRFMPEREVESARPLRSRQASRACWGDRSWFRAAQEQQLQDVTTQAITGMTAGGTNGGSPNREHPASQGALEAPGRGNPGDEDEREDENEKRVAA
ncbi:hypothetical protein ANO11243_072270 [Dothideomycetidae sp. 11243]|nr:hypothetical protein ANO11243_072270 [fungal sp. No.11243]